MGITILQGYDSWESIPSELIVPSNWINAVLTSHSGLNRYRIELLSDTSSINLRLAKRSTLVVSKCYFYWALKDKTHYTHSLDKKEKL